MKRPLTVIVPCKNERLNIVPCIESFWDLADEIIVADSGSTDETIELAQCFEKVRVIERDYITSGDFKTWAIPKPDSSAAVCSKLNLSAAVPSSARVNW